MPDALGHLSLGGSQRAHLNIGSPLRSPVIAEIIGLGSGNGQDHGRGCSSGTALGFSELVSQTDTHLPHQQPTWIKGPCKGNPTLGTLVMFPDQTLSSPDHSRDRMGGAQVQSEGDSHSSPNYLLTDMSLPWGNCPQLPVLCSALSGFVPHHYSHLLLGQSSPNLPCLLPPPQEKENHSAHPWKSSSLKRKGPSQRHPWTLRTPSWIVPELAGVAVQPVWGNSALDKCFSTGATRIVQGIGHK